MDFGRFGNKPRKKALLHSELPSTLPIAFNPLAFCIIIPSYLVTDENAEKKKNEEAVEYLLATLLLPHLVPF